jgi:prepilin-type N-terminal cleavage/methylation domain-containing protein
MTTAFFPWRSETMSGKSGKSNRRGFTLTEVLAVVAVLAIVAALAIPAVVKNWRSAKLTKWDETAREIFLSAQNETSEIKAAGLLQEMVQSESNTANDDNHGSAYVFLGKCGGVFSADPDAAVHSWRKLCFGFESSDRRCRGCVLL